MVVKVCGITSVEQISQLCKLHIVYVGLIFYPPSPRYFMGKIHPDELAEISTQIKLTGVFVNEDSRLVKEMIEKYHLKAVQLCGSESAGDCELLRQYAEVIKVVHSNDDGINTDAIKSYGSAVDYLLFDTKSPGFGGSGKKFNWSALSESNIEKPFFLSGGISVDDADGINRLQTPKPFGVDLNSRFEISPGIKDMEKIKQFVNQLNRNEIPGR